MIETKTEDYKSHKHNFNVYVEINSKTKLGQNLLDQYHREAQRQYTDIGRIGYHDHNGKYVLDREIVAELITVPKLIIVATEHAIDRGGDDVYKLRTYMSKFGQLNFLLTINNTFADLYLVEDVYIENLNHKETYETLVYRLSYSSKEPVPMRAIFCKYGIRANPDDYGKAWKNEENSVGSLIFSAAAATMMISMANRVASNVNQKALVASLNYLNKEGSYGKKVTKEYSSTVSKSKDLNTLSTSPKLENTLNNVLIKTLEQQTTKQDVKDKINYKVYKKVLEVQLSTHNEIKKEVEKENTKENLKTFMIDTISKHNQVEANENDLNNKKFEQFEKLIDTHFDKKMHNEPFKPIEQDFTQKEIKSLNVDPNQEFYNFENKKVEIDFDVSRFKKPIEASKKQEQKQQAKLQKKLEKKQIKQEKLKNKNIKVLNAECDLNREFERSKLTLGILPTDSKKKQKKALNKFLSDDKKEKKQSKKIKVNIAELEQEDVNIIEKIEKQVRSQKQLDKLTKQEKKKKKKLEKENKKQLKLSKNTENILGNNIADSSIKDNNNKKKKKKKKQKENVETDSYKKNIILLQEIEKLTNKNNNQTLQSGINSAYSAESYSYTNNLGQQVSAKPNIQNSNGATLNSQRTNANAIKKPPVQSGKTADETNTRNLGIYANYLHEDQAVKPTPEPEKKKEKPEAKKTKEEKDRELKEQLEKGSVIEDKIVYKYENVETISEMNQSAELYNNYNAVPRTPTQPQYVNPSPVMQPTQNNGIYNEKPFVETPRNEQPRSELFQNPAADVAHGQREGFLEVPRTTPTELQQKKPKKQDFGREM